MKLKKLMRYKGLTFATLGLVVCFVLYLLLNGVIQSRVMEQFKYSQAVSALAGGITPSLSSNASSDISSQLNAFELGKQVTIAGEVKDTVTLAKFLAPIESNVGAVIAALNKGDFSVAQQEAQTLSKNTQRRFDRKVSLTKYLQVAAGIIASLFYLLVILPMIMRLSDNEEASTEVVKESKGIMSTVAEGLFLLDHEQQIGIEQSASLKQMFKSERDLEGDFFDFIGKYVAPNTVQTAREYLGLLYGERVKEKLVKDLNPLNEVQINIVRRDGSYESRYLNFQFNRVIENEKLSHILVSVTDETQRVLLERELAETKEEQEAQIDLLMSILHVDSSQLANFLEAADTDLREVNQTLEARGHKDTEIRLKIDSIARTVHKLKGDASALALHRFEFSAHAFEEELVAVKANSGTLTGKELLPALTKLKDLFGELHQMESIVAKLGDHAAGDLVGNDTHTSAAEVVTSTPQMATSGISKALFDLTESVSERNGKRAHLNAYGLNEDDLSANVSSERQSDLQSIAVQLVRNSIVHGALSPDERLAKGKSDFINITTSLTNTENGHVLIVRDDGEGFDNQKIMDRAIELELFTPAQLSKLNPDHAFKLIFQPGFTSVSEANLDGGRGVGLDVVHSMVKELGGAVAVQHKTGLYCQFKITIPK